MNEVQALLVNMLHEAVNAVYKEERQLFQFSGGERSGLEQSFVFRTGIHLSMLLKGTPYDKLDMDSEYNKNHGEPKTSRRFPKGLRPDLIIHRRDSNQENKLVAEFKGWWTNDIEDDIKKLEDLTSLEDSCHYDIGIFVHIGIKEATYRYFINGSEI